MKLNNKGYMIIEIIMASMIAFGVAYFLFDLTINMKNKSDDLQARTIIMSDRAIIENYIIKTLNDSKKITCNGNYLRLTSNDDSISMIGFPNDGNNTPFYFAHKKGGLGSTAEVIYKKTANNYIESFNNYSLNCTDDNTKITIVVGMKDKLTDDNYDINLTYYK